MRNKSLRYMQSFSFAIAVAIGLPTTLEAQLPPVQLKEELRLDGNAEDFSILNGMRISPRGDIAIAMNSDGVVRIYDKDGKRLAVIGRRGSGPGEFSRVFGVRGWVADTVWTYDFMQRRLSWFTRNGKLLRTQLFVDPRTQLSTRDGKPAGTLQMFTPNAGSVDGSLIGIGTITGFEGAPTRGFSFVNVPRNGSARFIVHAPFSQRWQVSEFAPFTSVAFSPDGNTVAYGRVDEMVRTGGTFKIAMFTTAGDTVYHTTHPYVGVPLTKRYIDSVVARGIGIDRIRNVASDQIPPVRAPLRGMTMGNDRRVWATVLLSGNRQEARLLNERGVVIARLELPKTSTIVEAGAGYLWMQESDDDGIPSLVRYRFTIGR